MATVEVGNSSEFQAFADSIGDLSPVLDGLGALLTARATATFRKQAKGTKPWPARLTPNIPGIISDLNKGGNPKARRFDPGQALVDTGTLRRSIAWEVDGSGHTLTVGTTVPYAKVHNEGGSSKISLSADGRAKLVGWLRENKSLASPRLVLLLTKPNVTTRVRKREFLSIDNDDRKLIQKTIEDGIAELNGGQ